MRKWRPLCWWYVLSFVLALVKNIMWVHDYQTLKCCGRLLSMCWSVHPSTERLCFILTCQARNVWPVDVGWCQVVAEFKQRGFRQALRKCFLFEWGAPVSVDLGLFYLSRPFACIRTYRTHWGREKKSETHDRSTLNSCFWCHQYLRHACTHLFYSN